MFQLVLFVIYCMYNVVIIGVGGMGVVIIGVVLVQVVYIDGKGVGMMEMVGLVQKGGVVYIYLWLVNWL